MLSGPFVQRAVLVWLFFFAFSPALAAQEPAKVPTVTFTLDFPASDPEHYQITLTSDGHGVYESNGKLSPTAEDGDPSTLNFTVSAQTAARVLSLTAKAHYFEGDIDSKKKGIASTGTKTLTYTDGSKNTLASYNYSTLAPVQELTQIFQDLSTTLEFGRRLDYDHHYQKLALDEELKRMEEMTRQNSLRDLGAIGGLLQQIADDPSVINPVRNRARRLIERANAPAPDR